MTAGGLCEKSNGILIVQLCDTKNIPMLHTSIRVLCFSGTVFRYGVCNHGYESCWHSSNSDRYNQEDAITSTGEEASF